MIKLGFLYLISPVEEIDEYYELGSKNIERLTNIPY
jgi:hypothetical protein